MFYTFNNLSQHPDLKESKGVYCIKSEKGQQYIGSTCANFRKRWMTHLQHLKAGTHHSKHMQNCYNKHGADYFTLFILYYGEDRGDIIPKEQHYIDILRPKFNTAPIAGSPAGMQHSEEVIKQNRQRSRQKIIDEGLGVQFTPHNNYKITISLINHTLQIGGFLTEQEARDELTKLRTYFWSEEFESKTIIDQDEEVELCRLKHKIRIKTQRNPSGVYLGSKGKYISCLVVEGITITFGSFPSKEDAEEAYKKGRAVFVSEEFLKLSRENRCKFIKQFKTDYYDSCTTTGHRYITFRDGIYKFKYRRQYQKSFKTLEEAVQHKQEYFESGCILTNTRKLAESGHKYIRQDAKNSFRFFHKPSNHYRTFKTIDEAIMYRDQYISGSNFYETPKRISNSGHKYIFKLPSGKYKFQYVKEVRHSKTFTTLEECIAYKEQYLSKLIVGCSSN